MFNKSFIEVYDNALSEKECDILISQFEKTEKIEGNIIRDGQFVIDHSCKKSIELPNCKFSNKSVVSNIIRQSLIKCIHSYYNKYECLSYVDDWKYVDNYNFKKFECDDDGYKVWHTESGKSDITSKRILVWNYYLNDAKSGTEFMNFPKMKSKRGRCCIWPAAPTHVHRSEKNKGMKYIISGWISYLQ